MSLREKAGFNLPPAGSEASGGAGGGGERGMRRRWGGLLGGGEKDAAVGWFALESAWTLAAARAAAATASLYWASVEFAGAAGPEPSIDLPTVSSRINARVVGLNAEAAAMEAAHSVCELPPMEALPPHVSALKGLQSWQSVCAGGRSDAADARPPPSSVPSSIPLIGIEQSVWYHLLTWLSLVRRARGLPDAPQPVPSALRELSPPAPGGQWPEGAAADLPVQPPLGAYPAIRRAQKMSYIVTAMLPGLSEEDRCALASDQTAGRVWVPLSRVEGGRMLHVDRSPRSRVRGILHAPTPRRAHAPGSCLARSGSPRPNDKDTNATLGPSFPFPQKRGSHPDPIPTGHASRMAGTSCCELQASGVVSYASSSTCSSPSS